MQTEKMALPLEDLLGAEKAPREKLSRQFAAVLILSFSLALGVIGDVLFYRSLPGINIFIYVALLVLAGFWLLVTFKRPVVLHHALFALPALTFALMLGVRMAPDLIFFNLLALAGSLVIVLRFSSETRFLGGGWLAPAVAAVQMVLIDWFDGPITVLLESGRWIGGLKLGGARAANLKSLLRGLALTLPVVIVFGALLGSADVVFKDLTRHALALVVPGSLGSIVTQLFVIVCCTASGLIAFKEMVIPGLPQPLLPAQAASHTPKKPIFRLNMIEASMMLGSVNFLFAVFVAIQARYFFGGQANINAQGYTYAEYARRGFYELLAVSLMTMALIVSLDAQTVRKREEQPTFRLLVVGLVALTFVILVSAFRRLALYEEAYGFTRIRVMSGVFMAWLAIQLGVLLAAILRRRRTWFWTGGLVTALGFVLTLNLINMDGFIASRNIDRFHATGKLDIWYLIGLSDDAIPTVVPLLDDPRLAAGQRGVLRQQLGLRLRQLDQDRTQRGTWGYHVAKSRAWHALDARRAQLSADIPPDQPSSLPATPAPGP